jgi:ATP-dependent DNA helicase RecG
VYLSELTEPVSTLPGIGSRTAEVFAGLGVRTVADLLTYVPRSYEDRLTQRTFADAAPEGWVNTVAEVVAHDYVGRKGVLKIYVRDSTGVAALMCFNRNFLKSKLPPGMQIRLAGRFSHRFGDLQSSSFDFEPIEVDSGRFGRFVPIYPLTEGLANTKIVTATATALGKYAPRIDDEVPPKLLEARRLLPKAEALRKLHGPRSLEEAEAGRRRLAYDELLLLQLNLARHRQNRGRDGSKSTRLLPRSLMGRLLTELPFRLTPDQATTLEEIISDLQGPVPMSRLLQGDVGSGKTIVALLSALPYIEMGYQSVLMAPTELLARQHAEKAAELFGPLGLEVAFLSSSVESASRPGLLKAIAAGRAQLVVGTHALFSEGVEYKELRYVIVDEQQRFGVMQRRALVSKAAEPDLLMMTATPIPRTLAMTVFGDMNVSAIHSMPPGRRPVETHLTRLGNETKVYERVRRELEAGRQAYFVYPLIEQTEGSELRNAEEMAAYLSKEVYPKHAVGLIHSRLDEAEKERTMEGFYRGELDVLVATSVVEVGVDVPNATCMVIEHAERFGLSALHQLRGRVGRGSEQSFAFLIYAEPLTPEAKERLKVMHQENDGYVIAEEDLRIRGPGDVAGLRQSGFLKFRVADVATDIELMNQSRQDAFALLEADPGLLELPHQGLRKMLLSTGVLSPDADESESESGPGPGPEKKHNFGSTP